MSNTGVVMIALSLLVGCGSEPSSSTPASAGVVAATKYTFRIESTWNRKTMPQRPGDPLPDEEYEAQSADDRWEVEFSDGTSAASPLTASKVTLTKRDGKEVLHGANPTTQGGERSYALEAGAFAGGALLTNGKTATLTIYGSGVTVITSDRGTLLPK